MPTAARGQDGLELAGVLVEHLPHVGLLGGVHLVEAEPRGHGGQGELVEPVLEVDPGARDADLGLVDAELGAAGI